MKNFASSVIFFCLILFACNTAQASPKINAYFFWGDGCSHCAEEKSLLSNLKKKYPNLNIKSFEIYKDKHNSLIFRKAIDKFNITNIGVPLLIIGDKAFIGYSHGITPKEIQTKLHDCTRRNCADHFNINDAVRDEESVLLNTKVTKEITLPALGKINVTKAILPIFTIAMGILDGFNPCAMWVLLFLIGLLLNMEDKRKRWLLGGTFIFVSTMVYYVFMVAWLKLITFLSLIIWVRTGIGAVAIAAGAYSLREFFLRKEVACKVSGPINKATVFQKLKKIIYERSFPLALLGIIALAFTVNLVELACSAGLPATFIQVLLINNLSSLQYHLYILLYIFFFMLDDLFVFFIAMLALEVTGLTDKYTKYSKLIGGLLMLALGLFIIFKPDWLMFL
jgi:glutaredoxin/cytochrome c biogenesis protein CcdA